MPHFARHKHVHRTLTENRRARACTHAERLHHRSVGHTRRRRHLHVRHAQQGLGSRHERRPRHGLRPHEPTTHADGRITVIRLDHFVRSMLHGTVQVPGRTRLPGVRETRDEPVVDAAMTRIECRVRAVQMDTRGYASQNRALQRILQRKRLDAAKDDGMIHHSHTDVAAREQFLRHGRRKIHRKKHARRFRWHRRLRNQTHIVPCTRKMRRRMLVKPALHGRQRRIR